ncbi:hypothetical protein ACS0TY_033696 [Phlomoides rotata]
MSGSSLFIDVGRMWCHCRMVYLPMSYLYGKRFVGATNGLILSLRKEIYVEDYHQIDWNRARNQCCKGYNGSQVWDVVLGVEAILASHLAHEYDVMLKKAHEFIKLSQIRKDSSGHLSCWYRHTSKGGWPFSTADNGWPVSDCTAQGLNVALMLSQLPLEIAGNALEPDKLYDAVDLILSLQNISGGFASYELTRSYTWLEMMNPAETFGEIIIDYQYVECTSAVVQGLKLFNKLYPGYRQSNVEACIHKALEFIESIQLSDGSWYGSWGVCYTYGTWFGVMGLIKGGKTYENCSAVRKACEFLLSKQLPSGGWGESYLSSQDKVYTNIGKDKSHIVNTGWAMLALVEAGQEKRDAYPLHRAVKVLIDSQMENGDFPQQGMDHVITDVCVAPAGQGDYRRRELRTTTHDRVWNCSGRSVLRIKIAQKLIQLIPHARLVHNTEEFNFNMSSPNSVPNGNDDKLQPAPKKVKANNIVFSTMDLEARQLINAHSPANLSFVFTSSLVVRPVRAHMLRASAPPVVCRTIS